MSSQAYLFTHISSSTHAALLEVADDDIHAQLALRRRQVRRVGQPRDLTHPSRIRRTIGLRRRSLGISEKGILAPAEGVPHNHTQEGREGVSSMSLAPTSVWESPNLEGGVKRRMDEHGQIIPDEEFDELTEPKVESSGEETLALIEAHRRSMEVRSPMTVKRPRGRPRKHPVVPEPTNKITKGRSKTGCITCRKRKKKCDETKPRCKFAP